MLKWQTMSREPLTRASAAQAQFQFCWMNSTEKTPELKGSVVPAEHFAHHADKLQGALIANPIKDAIGILASHQYAFFAQDGQVLRNVALRGPDRFDDFLHAGFLISQHAQDFQAQGVRNRLERARGLFDMFLLVDETDLGRHGA